MFIYGVSIRHHNLASVTINKNYVIFTDIRLYIIIYYPLFSFQYTHYIEIKTSSTLVSMKIRINQEILRKTFLFNIKLVEEPLLKIDADIIGNLSRSQKTRKSLIIFGVIFLEIIVRFHNHYIDN